MLLVALLGIRASSTHIASAQDYSFSTIAGIRPSNVDGTNNVSRFRFPKNVVANENGRLTVLDSGSGSIRRLNRQGTNWVSTTILGTANNFGEPPHRPYPGFANSRGLAFRPDGNFYIGDYQQLRKAIFDGTNWTVQTVAEYIPLNPEIDLPASGIRFKQILELAWHPSGTLLIADGSELRALLEQGTNVTIHTIAQNTNSAPYVGLAVNKLGEVFATIGSDNTVVRIVQEGTNWVQTTIAGSAGTSGTVDGAGSGARFNQPGGITTDSAGNLYVVDISGETVRKIVRSGTNWFVTTIAGSAEKAGFADGTNNVARFFQPSWVSVDGAGHVFVADALNDAIRELAPAGTNWIVRTIAGNHPNSDGSDETANRFLYPQGIAVDEDGGIFVADTYTCTIKQVSRDRGIWTTRIIAGQPGVVGTNDGPGLEAQLGPVERITIGANHHLYASDEFAKIRELVKEGTNWTVSTIVDFPRALHNPGATNPPDGFFVPGGLAADRLGNLYASLPMLGSIYRISPGIAQWNISKIADLGAYENPLAGLIPYSNPMGLAVAPDGTSVFVADELGLIRQLMPDITGTNWTSRTIAGAFQRLDNSDGPGEQAGFLNPIGIAVDGQGRLYVVGYNPTVRRIDPIGTNWVVRTIGGFVNVFDYPATFPDSDGIGSVARFSNAFSIAVDSSGNVYLPDFNNWTIRMGSPVFPSLQINLYGSNTVLSWPSWASDFTLESTDSLSISNTWTAAGEPDFVNNQNIRTNQPTDSSRFFRLRQK